MPAWISTQPQVEVEDLPREIVLYSPEGADEPRSYGPGTAEPGAEDGGDGAFRLPDAGVTLEEVERDLVKQALERTSGNQTHAARLLNISRDALRYKMKKFGFL